MTTSFFGVHFPARLCAIAILLLVPGLAWAQPAKPGDAKPPAAPVTATPPPAIPPSGSYLTHILVPGSHFHGIHGLAFDRDDQLYAGSVVGQAIYKVEIFSGEVEVNVAPPKGMADDIAFAPDGSMAWTSYLTGQVYGRTKPGEPIRELANNLPGINSLAFTKDGRLFASQDFLADALWEIDISGLKPDAPKTEIPPKPARKILENLGGLNGFEFGPDGMLYGPLWFKGTVVKIDVEKKTVTTVASGFKIPAAVNFASTGDLYVVDTALGQVVKVDVNTGQKTLIATVKPSIDNLAIDSRDRIFITNMADNGIYLIDKDTGQSRTIVEGKLSIPGDIAVFSDGKGGETLYVADVFAYRSVDGNSGEVKTILRMQADQLEYPFGVSVNAKHVLLSSWFTNSVEVIDRLSGKPLDIMHDFKTPTDTLEQDDGSILVLEMGTGSLLRVKGPGGKDRVVVAKDLNGPVAMASAGPGAVYVSEIGSGSVVRIDLAKGTKTVVASNLKSPEGLDVAPDGRIVVAEVGARRVVAIDPKTGQLTVLASNLSIGLDGFKVGPPQYVPTGVAVGKSGAVYVSSDIKNAIYKLTPP